MMTDATRIIQHLRNNARKNNPFLVKETDDHAALEDARNNIKKEIISVKSGLNDYDARISRVKNSLESSTPLRTVQGAVPIHHSLAKTLRQSL
jgi:hypothetical protein